MPQSKHRKTNKAKKRAKGLYPAAKAKPAGGSNSTARTIAIVVVLALAASAVAYLIVNRGGKGGEEITTASGLKYTDLVVGTGASPQKGQTVTANYTGKLQDGTKFDSSADHGEPMKFRFGGWPRFLLQGLCT